MTDGDKFVRIHEVGPRDGLQNEPNVISVADKVALIDMLSGSGLRDIEVGSFVSPKWVPQMADSDQVLAQMTPAPEVRYAVLVPNMRGWEGFVAARQPDVTYEVAVFISASEGFSRSNLNCSIAESVERLLPVVQAAQDAGIALRGYISCVTDCPFDGPVAPDAVAQAASLLRAAAPMPLSLGDTIGKATPDRVTAMLRAVLDVAPVDDIAGHFHDTGGQALANIAASMDMGVRAFDSSVAGLGGCPYAPGASGNVATESVLEMLHAQGFETGINEEVIAKAAAFARGLR
ncbi:hydroxymethylglutaryl-CoA lyase [Yoonia sediminilitoris]|uniref:hydroxymethylglutaryl-CoA lyase n=1 Tax=Yoonia sediminilitoris TaxID=1286148 RepID=A0A2T6KR84_9RHOB|nr:hydroxymethylglutaryl-CoA lyase [Yoonia sediminilitoris]PUB19063.1 hydroxymethylglutaryl-CoA lyase [Yoonia sediminilitoris]RCW99231.1 hydroxymethylglutaryl-CoA lyase [Yoonia sediminilitoris]